MPTDSDLQTLLAGVMANDDGALSPPIVQSSLFTFPDYASFAERMAGGSDRPIYSRIGNPTVAAFESMMARAEGGEAAVGFASGMAAISSTVLAFVRPGDRIAVVEHVYPDAYRFFEQIARPFGIEVTYHSPEALGADPACLRGAKMAYLESPTSMVFQTIPLAKVAAIARAEGVLTVVDNSWATPVNQRPLELGIDISLHSASKYISGHSDTVAGVVVASEALIAQIRSLTLALLGGKLAPFEAWLLVRGLRTLAPRMRTHSETAALFVDRLGALPEVTRINAPGPNSVAGLTGRSGLLSVELAETIDIPALVDALAHFHIGVSWGGYESLVMPAMATLGQAGDINAARRFGVSPRTVRLSLGLESAEDLWSDFASALATARR